MGQILSLFREKPAPVAGRTLRWYQDEAVTRALAGKERTRLIVKPTGTGKTIVAAEICRRFDQGRILFLAENRRILRQAQEKISRWLGGSPEDIGFEQAESKSHGERIVCGMRQTLANPMRLERLDERGEPQLIIVDEAHHFAGREGSQYQRIVGRYPNATVIGLTATPDRADKQALEQAWAEVVYTLEIHDAIADGYLVEPVPVTSDDFEPLDVSQVKVKGGELDDEAIEAMLATIVRQQAKEIVKNCERLKTIVFCGRVTTAHQLAKAVDFEMGRACAVAIDGEMDEDARDRVLDGFEAGEHQFLVNVGICVEGFDCLDRETQILTTDGWKGRGQVRVGDIMWAYNRDTGAAERVPVERYVEREVAPGEKMFGVVGQHVNIRTTEGHEFHVRGRSGVGLSRKMVTRNGRSLVERGSAYALPLCGNGTFPGVALTDDELRFVAWFMTDGHFEKDRQELCISQSKPEKEEIRSLLQRIGFDFRERVRQPGRGAYPNSKPITVFNVPKGTDRGAKARRGWYRLSAFLDKQVAPLLHQMDARQFRVFWAELLKGDGSRSPGKAGWLWCSERAQADAYTAMAVVRGLASSCAPERTKGGATVFRVSAREAEWLVSNPGDPRAARMALVDPEAGESVWCVTNALSTLFARRHGKVAVIGNCPDASAVVLTRPYRSRGPWVQRVGRGLRPLGNIGLDQLPDAAARRAAIAASAKPHMKLVNFKFLPGRHTLVCPEDILGGKYSDEEKEKAKELREDGEAVSISDALAKARDAIEAERRARAEAVRKAKAQAKIEWGTFDPFGALNMEMPDTGLFTTEVPQRASAKMKAWLRGQGLKVPESITKAQAQKLRGTIEVRKNIGLASMDQLQKLNAFGITDAQKWTSAQASAELTARSRSSRPAVTGQLQWLAWRGVKADGWSYDQAAKRMSEMQKAGKR